VTQLCQHREELERLNVEVVLVTFSSAGYGRVWLKEVCSTFRLLIDREREIYALYDLTRSLLRAWSLKTVRRYIELMRAGRRWRGIQGDSTQLGGDFVIDAQGIVRLAHPSRDPTDRPAVDELLALLRRLTEEKKS
jgi:peroxiredoxin